MGLEFGKLPIRIRRILYYSLAPEEQRAWAKSVTHGIPNLVDRIIYALPTVLPGFIMSAVIYKWSTAAHEQYIRKDPKLYENDK
ncbi:hypothetical protein DMN91_000765 [Ooceraea biroi]|uniref:Cytochrome b-c1 complex subunit 8 n=1 Tax=Ooceraea biroi TaxID=2015173 RepID=A0A3L8E2V0_OOCBI|nr:cytochrome b-c1 complex subunit 8 [Ooceraea biroi]RLU26966.1 hypothetical protein DMN91_000765 [Ooceraea biroi]